MRPDAHRYDDQLVLPGLFEMTGASRHVANDGVYFSAPDIDLSDYDHFVVCLSGGLDCERASPEGARRRHEPR